MELANNSTALELALAKLAEDRLKLDAGAIKISLTPVQANDEILPFIAWQEHVDQWVEDYSRDQKLQIIQTAKKVHSSKGTIGALKLALANLGLDAKVLEWWAYDGGKPYHFKIDVNVSQTGIDAKLDKNLSLIVEETKNLRSLLDGIKLWFTSFSKSHASMINQIGEYISVLPFIQTRIEQPAFNPFIAIMKQSLETITIYPKEAM